MLLIRELDTDLTEQGKNLEFKFRRSVFKRVREDVDYRLFIGTVCLSSFELDMCQVELCLDFDLCEVVWVHFKRCEGLTQENHRLADILHQKVNLNQEKFRLKFDRKETIRAA